MTLDDFNDAVSGQAPWSARNWHGGYVSLNEDVSDEGFNSKDIWKVLAANNTGSGWDGKAAAVVLLRDGRWAAWESSWGPTGSGFCEDAYGGDVIVYLAASLDEAIMLGLTSSARKLLGLDVENWSDPDAKIPELKEIKNGFTISVETK
jgi:hypothetical protein